ncbi:M56 family metallopeptidase [Pedobacter psychrophilus]|nr:M56 family metallopeptidase [Pedobacter psychrophilus]
MKINFVLLLFTGAYYLILKNFTFYNLNRFYLVFGIIFSSLYPFINLTDFFYRNQDNFATVGKVVKSINKEPIIKPQLFVDFYGIIITVIIIGIITFMLRLFIQLYSLYQIHQKTQLDYLNNLKIRILKDKVSPFSFWRTIYINPSIYSKNDLNTILAHEKIHVEQLHTLDILIAELSTVFYWFNPGIWLMKKAIKENIEFITDDKILNSGIDKKEYQYSLLSVNNLKLQTNLVNSFNFSDIKKRISMMNVRKSAKSKIISYVIILPLLLSTCLAFTVSIVNKESIADFTALKPPSDFVNNINKTVYQKEIQKSPKKLTLSVKLLKVSVDSSGVKNSLGLNSISSLTIDEKLGLEDTSEYNPTILIAKLNTISDKLRKNITDLKDVSVDNIKIGITPNAGTANYKIKKIAFINVNNHPEINPQDSSKITYYLNGKILDSKNLDLIKSSDIKKISVQKNKITGTGIMIESN